MSRYVTFSLVLASGVLTGGCDRDPSPAEFPPLNLFDESGGERDFRDVQFDTLWTYGSGDSVLASALSIAAFENGDAAVLDVVGQQVHRVGPTGWVWSWGRRGEGPRELRNVRAFAINGNDEVVLADSGNQRLVWVSSEGQWLREVRLRPVSEDWTSGMVAGIVSLEGGGYVLARDASQQPWTIVSETGDTSRVVPSPWQGFGGMNWLQTHGQLSGGAGRRWVFGFAVGNGFFVFADSAAQGIYPYVEHMDFPSVITAGLPGGGFRLSYARTPVRAAHDMTVSGDTLLVLVRNWRLDRYDLTTGGYIDTVELPGPMRGVATFGSALMFIDMAGMFPAITVLQPREESDDEES